MRLKRIKHCKKQELGSEVVKFTSVLRQGKKWSTRTAKKVIDIYKRGNSTRKISKQLKTKGLPDL